MLKKRGGIQVNGDPSGALLVGVAELNRLYMFTDTFPLPNLRLAPKVMTRLAGNRRVFTCKSV